MTSVRSADSVQHAVKQAWNRKSSATNMDRWLTMCEHENWGNYPDNITLLAKIFGASWYFTRFIFYRGSEVVKYLDSEITTDFSKDNILRKLHWDNKKDDLEEQFDQLRIDKNEIMFQIFLAHLDRKLNQEQQEAALTNLAEGTLQYALELLAATYKADGDASILAMGRMAGWEMNYGSDLDLIFLYGKESGKDQSVLIRQIQALLRHIALPTPFGILYEIDMRLRPHGTSGTLISPAQSFIEYHKDEREIWERQMMTRCRPVFDKTGLAEAAINTINLSIYSQHDGNQLKSEVIRMRKKVQEELGNPKDKYEIKRGYGGIMDIDFLTHYLQLSNGHGSPELQTPSTRSALRQLGNLGLLQEQQVDELLTAYDFLKKIEGVLRVMDMKSISAFSRDPADPGVLTLARAMGFDQDDNEASVVEFMEQYSDTTQRIRGHFIDNVGVLD